MSLKDLLEAMGTRTVMPVVGLPREPRMAVARTTVERRLDSFYAKAVGMDLDALHHRLRQASAADRWDLISDRDWRFVPLCLLKGPPPLLKHRKFMERYATIVKQNPSPMALRQLLRIYLAQFDPESDGIRIIGDLLGRSADRLGKEWKERHSSVSLFDPKAATSRLVASIMKSSGTPLEYLEAMGLERASSTTRLAACVFVESLGQIRHQLSAQPSLELIRRTVAWGMREDKEFRYAMLPGARGKLADALLLPWVSRDPSSEIREFIEHFILEHYKDLRLNHSRWNDVSEDARRVMKRWLTKASLDWFLNVVDETTTDVNYRHMWPQRRKFWGAYYKNGYMQEAWVVFGRSGVEYAARLNAANRAGGSSPVSFGRLLGQGMVRNHAVLVMRVGDLTIADWNFNGKCHIWLGRNDRAPDLYKSEYDRNDLTSGSDFQQSHRGSWQTSIYDYLLSHTGASMRRSEYF